MTAKDEWIKSAIEARYLVATEDGRVFRLHHIDQRTGKRHYRRIKTSVHRKTGRVYFNLEWHEQRKSVLLNRVVALAFLPNPDELPEVNHKDGDKQHNAVSNLEWADRDTQERHAQKTGLKSGRGSQNANARLDAEKVERIRSLAKDGFSETDLAACFKVSETTVRDVLQNKTWVHV